MQIRGVFFDLYGTLFLPPDPATAARAWTGACYRELARRGLQEAEPAFLDRLAGLWQSLPPREPGLTPFEARLAALSKDLGLALPRAEAAAVADAVCAQWQTVLRLDPEAHGCLAALSGRRLRLVSNYEHPRHVRSVLTAAGLARYFDRVVISGEVGLEKPDPAILTLASAGSGLRPEQIAYVGDSIVDYEAAAGAGMKPVLVRRSGQVSGDVPDRLRVRYGRPEDILAAAAARGELVVVGALREVAAAVTSA